MAKSDRTTSGKNNLADILAGLGWTEVSGGAWAKMTSHNGGIKVSMHEAACEEMMRLGQRVQWFQEQMNEIREALDLTCTYSEMAETVRLLRRSWQKNERAASSATIRKMIPNDLCFAAELPSPYRELRRKTIKALDRAVVSDLESTMANVAEHERLIGMLVTVMLHLENETIESPPNLTEFRKALEGLRIWLVVRSETNDDGAHARY